MGKWGRLVRVLRARWDPRRREEQALKARLTPEFGRWLLEPVERYMPLERWGFRLTYVEVHPARAGLIYDSPACRVNFNYVPGRFPGDHRIGIHYARSHVPNDVDLIMEWRSCVTPGTTSASMPITAFWRGILWKRQWSSTVPILTAGRPGTIACKRSVPP